MQTGFDQEVEVHEGAGYMSPNQKDQQNSSWWSDSYMEQDKSTTKRVQCSCCVHSETTEQVQVHKDSEQTRIGFSGDLKSYVIFTKNYNSLCLGFN